MTDKKAIPCAAYCRVSSKRQLDEGFSIPAQKRYLKDFAKANNYLIKEFFEDDETAGKKGREGFEEMVKYLKKNKKINTIIVEKTDRMYRNFRDYIDIEDLGIDIILVKENEVVGPNANSHTKFIHGIKVLMAKNFLDNLSEEVQKGYNEKLQQGLYPSNPMFGYRTEKIDGKRFLVPKDKESEVVKRIFDLYSSGLYSVQAVADKLNEEGLLLDLSRKVNKSSVHTILRNPVYNGDFKWKGKVYKGVHEALVNKSTWKQCQDILSRNPNKSQANRYNTLSFFFRGLLICGECGRTVTFERKKKKYVYCRCTKHNTNCKQKPVREKVLLDQTEDIIKQINVPKEVVEFVTEALKESFELKRETYNKRIKSLKIENSKIESKLDKLYDDRLESKIDEEMYDRTYSSLKIKKARITAELDKFDKANHEYQNIGLEILELAKNVSRIYRQANDEEKKQMLGFLLSNFYLMDGKLIPNWKKPFELLVKHTSCSEWQAHQDLNPNFWFWRPTCYH